MSELLLAKELQEYTKIVACHNDHIQKVASKLVEYFEQPQLNENQKIVMDWLKENYNHKYSKRREVFWALSMFTTNSMYEDFSKESVGIAYSKLDNQQFAQVLEAFAKWAQEMEGE